jgi:hypothetical protein
MNFSVSLFFSRFPALFKCLNYPRNTRTRKECPSIKTTKNQKQICWEISANPSITGKPSCEGGIRFPLTTVGRRSEWRRRRRRRYRTAVSIVTDELVATAGTFPPTNPCLYFGVNPPPFPPTRPKSILRRMTIRRDTYTTHSKVKGSYS